MSSRGKSRFPSLIKVRQSVTASRRIFVVAQQLILEIKAVTTILAIHEVQLRTYLRMSGIHVGLLLNFNVPRLVDGLRRYVM